MVATRSSSGTKTDTPLIETPQSISVITRKQLDQQNFTTVAQSLQYVPGVATGTRGGYDARFDFATIRGFNESIQGDYRDGLRQNVGVGSFFSYFGTEPYGLDRIDVIRGPSSVLYGQNAPGGIIDRISKRPTEVAFGEVQGNLGNNHFGQGQFDLGGPVTPEGGLLYRLTGVVRDAEAPFPRTKNDRTYIAPAVTAKIDPDTTLTVLSSYENDRTGVGTVARSAAGRVTGIYLDDPTFSSFHREQVQAGYQFEHRFDDVLSFRQNFRYGEVSTHYNPLNQLSASGNLINRFAMSVHEKLDTVALDNQLQVKGFTGPVGHTALLGFDYFQSGLRQFIRQGLAPSLDLSNPRYFVPIPAPAAISSNALQKVDQYGLYLQDQMKFDRWILVLSGRQDFADSQANNYVRPSRTTVTNDATTGRAALLYASEIGLSPYGSVSTSFVPNLGTNRLNQAFAPTTGIQEEIGLKYQPIGWNVFTTVSLFNITQDNVLTVDPLNGSFQTQTGRVASRGVEVELRGDLPSGFGFIAAYTYDDVYNVRSNPANTVDKVPIAVPRQLASGWLTYTVPTGAYRGLGAGAGIRYTGPTFADAVNIQRNPDFLYLDLETHYDTGAWRFQVNASNVTDLRKATCFGGVCTRNENRFVEASLRYRW